MEALSQPFSFETLRMHSRKQVALTPKTIPYVLKLADLGSVVGQDGKINEETLQTSLNKVLEDVPALKPQPGGSGGFVRVGAGDGNQNQNTTNEDALKKMFGL